MGQEQSTPEQRRKNVKGGVRRRTERQDEHHSQRDRERERENERERERERERECEQESQRKQDVEKKRKHDEDKKRKQKKQHESEEDQDQDDAEEEPVPTQDASDESRSDDDDDDDDEGNEEQEDPERIPDLCVYALFRTQPFELLGVFYTPEEAIDDALQHANEDKRSVQLGNNFTIMECELDSPNTVSKLQPDHLKRPYRKYFLKPTKETTEEDTTSTLVEAFFNEE